MARHPKASARRAGAALTGATMLAGAAALAGCAGSTHHRAAADDRTIVVTPTTCAAHWVAQRAGQEHFTVRNDGRTTMRVTLIDAASGGIYGQVWQLGRGTSRSLDFVVPAGRYRWRCVPITGAATVSPVRPISGHGGQGVQPLLPLSSEEINDAMAEYHDAVQRGMTALVAATGRLRTAVVAGDLAAARARWLAAHLAYERLGAAYGTFGDSDGAINGRPDGLPAGVRDRGFTGFLRIEYGLWHGQSATVLRPIVDRLNTDVRALARKFPRLQIVPADIPLRAHEILENTLQFELTGHTDMGSHTNLATAAANTAGSATVLDAVTQQLRQRDPVLYARCRRELTGFAALVRRYDHSGHWTALSTLDRDARQQLDARLGALLESLDLIPNVLQMPPSTAPT